jgi:hypothetical protein
MPSGHVVAVSDGGTETTLFVVVEGRPVVPDRVVVVVVMVDVVLVVDVVVLVEVVVVGVSLLLWQATENSAHSATTMVTAETRDERECRTDGSRFAASPPDAGVNCASDISHPRR